MATPSQRNSDPARPRGPAASRRVKKTNAAPPARSVAAEAAQIYPDTFDSPPSPEEIAAEAYAIYCERGYCDGQDMDDWLEAERRLSTRRMSRRNEAQEE